MVLLISRKWRLFATISLLLLVWDLNVPLLHTGSYARNN
jgi:hypothetical protein